MLKFSCNDVVAFQGSSNQNINCSRFELKQPFKAILTDPERQSEYLRNVQTSNSEQT